MKKIFFILCFLSFKVYAQEPTYVPMKSNYLYRGIKMDSLFLPPVYPDTSTGTTKVNFAGSMIRVGSKLYMRNSALTQWVDLSSAGGGVATDTTSLSNRINQKVDSVNRIGDSVYYYKNGVAYFAFKDSIGGQNGRWGNDTATIVLAKVRNSTATTMSRGTVVMLKGATGDVASVIRANNKSDTTSARTIGLVKDPINAGDTGWVVTQGQASKLNLGSFTEGDVLYLDSIDGGLTKVKPQAPYHIVFIGIVERANNGNGLAYIKPQNGYELDELHDVRITNPINNEVLAYSDTQKLWKNRNIYSIIDTLGLSNRINALNLDSVVKKGNGTTSPIYIFEHLGITDASLGGDGKIYFDNETFSFLNQNDEAIFRTYKNTIELLDSAGNIATIKTLNYGSNLTITLPDVSGQLLTTQGANSTYLAKLDTTNMLKNYQRSSSFPIAVFGAGSGAAGDTSAFTTSAIYGSFYNSGVDTIILTSYVGVLQGTSPSITPTIYFNDTLNATAAATKIVNSPSAVTSTTAGNIVTTLDNTKIPPGNHVWVRTETVGTKPTYFSLTLIGYRKR